jgi:hypothetical protein
VKGKVLKSTSVPNAEAFGWIEVNWTRSLNGLLRRCPKGRPEKAIMIVVAAMAVALLIIKAAYELTVKSGRDLMDAGLPTEEEVQVGGIIRQHQSDIHGFHDLRTRRAGGFRFVGFHMKVNPQMTVEESHRITDAIAARIELQFPRTRVTIHAEPCDGNWVGKCLEGRSLQTKVADLRVEL